MLTQTNTSFRRRPSPAVTAAALLLASTTAGVVIDYGLKRKVSQDDGLWYLWEPMSFGNFTSNLRPDTAPASPPPRALRPEWTRSRRGWSPATVAARRSSA